MASAAVARQFGLESAPLLTMPEPKLALIADCVKLANEIKAKCPVAQKEVSRLLLWLDTMEREAQLESIPYSPPVKLSQCRNIYEAVIAFLRQHPDRKASEQEIFEALVEGDAPKMSLPDPLDRFRKSIGNKNRQDLEIIESESGRLEDRIIRLKIIAKHPPRVAG